MTAPASSQSLALTGRLRAYLPLASDDGVVLAYVAIFKEAADEIDHLTAEVTKLREALTDVIGRIDGGSKHRLLADIAAIARAALPREPA